MTENELAKALLDLDTADTEHLTTTADMTRQVFRKDQRKVRITACLTLLFWLASLGALCWSTVSFSSKHSDVLQGTSPNVDPLIADLAYSMFVLQASIEGIIFAVLCTLLLLYFSRRATLRQVNSSLLEISAQLQAIKDSAAQ